jgi:hypothetical protein
MDGMHRIKRHNTIPKEPNTYRESINQNLLLSTTLKMENSPLKLSSSFHRTNSSKFITPSFSKMFVVLKTVFQAFYESGLNFEGRRRINSRS